MANRHLLRTLIMQALYEREFQQDEKLADIAERNLRTSGKSDEDGEYVRKTIEGIQSKQPKIDDMIRQNAPEWPLEQIATIDRAVLRLGVYEVLYSDDVPPKVAINEAVELAKAYGGENSGSFINGVLGTVYRASSKYADEAEEDKKEKPAKTTDGK